METKPNFSNQTKNELKPHPDGFELDQDYNPIFALQIIDSEAELRALSKGLKATREADTKSGKSIAEVLGRAGIYSVVESASQFTEETPSSPAAKEVDFIVFSYFPGSESARRMGYLIAKGEMVGEVIDRNFVDYNLPHPNDTIHKINETIVNLEESKRNSSLHEMSKLVENMRNKKDHKAKEKINFLINRYLNLANIDLSGASLDRSGVDEVTLSAAVGIANTAEDSPLAGSDAATTVAMAQFGELSKLSSFSPIDKEYLKMLQRVFLGASADKTRRNTGFAKQSYSETVLKGIDETTTNYIRLGKEGKLDGQVVSDLALDVAEALKYGVTAKFDFSPNNPYSVLAKYKRNSSQQLTNV